MTKGAGDGEIAEFYLVEAVEEVAKWSILGHTIRRFSLCLFLFPCFDGFRLDLMWSEAAQNTYLAMCRNFNIFAIH
jgi:hypothetical protein